MENKPIYYDKDELEAYKKEFPACAEKLQKEADNLCVMYNQVPFKSEVKYRILPKIKRALKFYNPNYIEEKKEKKEKKDTSEPSMIINPILDKNLLIRNLLDENPIYFDEIQNFWIWDKFQNYWKIVDETDILNIIRLASGVNTINNTEKSELLNAVKQQARNRKPESSDSFLQFKDEIINWATGEKFLPSPKYFVTNPLPYTQSHTSATPTLDKLFSEWVSPMDVPKLYETLAFCMYPKYFIERVIVLYGTGCNGKSVFRQILRKFIGDTNCVSTSLELLSSSRFETAKLFKKLVCEMGETNLSRLDNTEKIKRLVSGKDLVGGEFKNKKPFDFVNYAKLIISTNNLPPTEDKTDGWYRKFLIIDFPNTFDEDRDILSEIPEQEFHNLAGKCLNILNDLQKRKVFTNEGDFKTRRERYEARSNPFDKFFREYVDDTDPNTDVSKWEFEKKLNEWLKENRCRMLSDISINKFMREKGVKDGSIWKKWYEEGTEKSRAVKSWLGVKFK